MTLNPRTLKTGLDARVGRQSVSQGGLQMPEAPHEPGASDTEEKHLAEL